MQAKMKESAETFVSGTSSFLPKNGPMSVKAAISTQAVLGVPDFGSSFAKEAGSCPLRPMASMMRVVAPKKEFIGPMGPRVPMQSMAT